ncbi:hypothetical protein [Abyssibacter profundi]|uniref:Uncharacterized protein n=1 Tax=Abyssibacter profundi TaxID=2182787 RepID=A0A363UL98_9GAMM|nr:hypothetical protein [Abyssibacter profundi]PWN56184.1 hypothetical protein DEH80_07880 [Abyssibacter profundi]
MIGQPLFSIEPHSAGAFRARMARRLLQAQGLHAAADTLRRAYNNRRAAQEQLFCVLVDGRAINTYAASRAEAQLKYPAATGIVPVTQAGSNE